MKEFIEWAISVWQIFAILGVMGIIASVCVIMHE